MTVSFYPKQKYKNQEDLERDYNRIMTLILQGKLDNTGTFTLTANSATTTVTEAPNRIGTGTVILWSPTTANAAAEMVNLYISGRSTTANTFTLTHTNNAQVDRTYDYVIIGY